MKKTTAIWEEQGEDRSSILYKMGVKLKFSRRSLHNGCCKNTAWKPVPYSNMLWSSLSQSSQARTLVQYGFGAKLLPTKLKHAKAGVTPQLQLDAPYSRLISFLAAFLCTSRNLHPSWWSTSGDLLGHQIPKFFMIWTDKPGRENMWRQIGTRNEVS